MGSSLKPKSTRAVKTHAVPKSRRKPAPPKPSEIHVAADAVRQAREQRADTILKAARATTPARPIADTLRDTQDRVPMTGALSQIRDKLNVACSCAIVVEHALMEQNCELDGDAARVLKRCVGDELDRQIKRIDLLLGRSRREDQAENDGREHDTGGAK